MKLIKKINNNFALAEDSRGETIIVEGRGVGFQKMPCELTDLSLISHTYYDTEEQSISLLNSLSPDVLSVASKIYDYAIANCPAAMNPHLTFILADHIQFAIERKHKNIRFDLPLSLDVKHLYPKEYKIAEYAMCLIEEELYEKLDDTEIAGIAMNILNSEVDGSSSRDEKAELTQACKRIVEKTMGYEISEDSFNYSRFVSHLQYLYNRADEQKHASAENIALYQSLSKRYGKVSDCTDSIEHYLNRHNYYLNEEEKLYLMLHINRMCSREDCNR